MNQVDFRQLEAACVRRRLLSAVMKLPCSLYCSLWFLLLLGAGSLLLLVRLQDLSEMVQQQTPGQWLFVLCGVKLNFILRHMPALVAENN